MDVVSFGLSDTGKIRTKNEDAWIACPELGCWALADGMGGYPGGEVASKEALQCLKEGIAQVGHDNVEEMLQRAIIATHRWVLHVARKNPELLGMATTLCCLLFRNECAYLAHVGDSRIYRLRNRSLELLTRDHSRLVEWYLGGKVKKRPEKHLLTRGIGLENASQSELTVQPLEKGDLFLLCTDGLSDLLPLELLEKILLDSSSPEEASRILIEEANRRGGPDNITALVVRYLGPML